jgi:hypothetical protein
MIEYGHGDNRKIWHKYDDKIFQKTIEDLQYREFKIMEGDTIFVPIVP